MPHATSSLVGRPRHHGLSVRSLLLCVRAYQDEAVLRSILVGPLVTRLAVHRLFKAAKPPHVCTHAGHHREPPPRRHGRHSELPPPHHKTAVCARTRHNDLPPQPLEPRVARQGRPPRWGCHSCGGRRPAPAAQLARAVPAQAPAKNQSRASSHTSPRSFPADPVTGAAGFRPPAPPAMARGHIARFATFLGS
jgi:hypothetical protein